MNPDIVISREKFGLFAGAAGKPERRDLATRATGAKTHKPVKAPHPNQF